MGEWGREVEVRGPNTAPSEAEECLGTELVAALFGERYIR